MTQELTLYHYWRSSCSWRVRWALAIKKIPANLVPINLLKSEHKSHVYLAKNPDETVPSMEINGHTYGESLALLEWVEQTYPNPSILPKDPLEKLKVRQLAYIIAMGTQPIQNLKVLKYISDSRSEQIKFANYWVQRGLKTYETLLDGKKGDYSAGNKITLADLCLIPQCYNAQRFHVDLEEFPKIKKIYENCIKTRECQETAPEIYKADF